MNKSVKQEEFDKFRRAINISIDSLTRKITTNKYYNKYDTASREELIQHVKLANAKFNAMEEAINLIFSILESHDMNIITCMHCKQPLPKANNDN
jgi:hypothetical protein